MKKIIIVLLSVCFLLGQDKSFKTEDVKLLPHDVKIKDLRYIKLHQEEIRNIIKKFDELLNNLKGYEEYYLVNDIKNLFIKRYYIENSDMIEIDRNLNKILHEKIKKEIKVLESK